MAVSRFDEVNRAAVSEPLARNIDELMQRRRRDQANEHLSVKAAARIAAFAGSVWSLLVHAVVFGAWIVVNVGLVPLVPAWDPTLVVLAMIASVESIFLTTFVLMNQRRQSRLEDDRAELTLHTSLLAEHETTKIANLTMAIAERLGISLPNGEDLKNVAKSVTPNAVLDEIERKRPDRS